ncbi:MAG: hypothetical protein KJO39_11770 [Bacteroidia bacterium]|nr:hypothetical protein [Bacteroidia bacterium]NNF31760.1 hypothetical protein [Flavobacteriaceae bacterium]NNJ81349.1 hypothetical protein [Flavobacteriaceae bacterium]NNK55274.1 hypothetical protein [Flavobacteriaceae bacterium]NNM10269.1 hypothetical protein [Flavobacteriaceae bacterium]
MSAKVLIILVGIVLIGVAVLSSLSKKDSKTTLINPKVGIPMGVLGVLMVIFGSYSSDVGYVSSQMEQISTGNKMELEGPVNSVKVISPIEADSVDCRILSMGVYPKGHEKDIWVVLKPSDNKYYPQSDHTNTSYKRDGEWQVVTRFGGDKEEKYELIVYETDASASMFFSNTILDWKNKESYPGLEETDLPSGATEVDRITVYLRKNCRGVF